MTTMLLNSSVDDESPILCVFPDYVELTRSKVLCAKSAKLESIKDIVIGRKSIIDQEVEIRADLEKVTIGQYCYIGDRTVLRPPRRPKLGAGGIPFVEASGAAGGGGAAAEPAEHSKLSIGSYVVCGQDCVVEALVIGSYVRICDDCVIGENCVIKDCCLLCPGSVLPPHMVVPPFAIVEGSPAHIVGELPESAAEEYKLQAERTCRRRVFQRSSSQPQARGAVDDVADEQQSHEQGEQEGGGGDGDDEEQQTTSSDTT